MTQIQRPERRCTNCGKSVDELPYKFWLFHICRSCSYEADVKVRWNYTERRRKLRYLPKWHWAKRRDLEQMMGGSDA